MAVKPADEIQRNAQDTTETPSFTRDSTQRGSAQAPNREVQLKGGIFTSDPATRTADQAPHMEVRLPEGVLTSEPSSRVPERERFAGDIAKQVIWVFAGSLAGAFITVALLVSLAMTSNPNDVMNKVVPAMSSFLEIFKIIGGLFSPLLAFILGYYFSLESRTSNTPGQD